MAFYKAVGIIMKYLFIVVLALLLFVGGVYHKELLDLVQDKGNIEASSGNSPEILLTKIKELNTANAKFTEPKDYPVRGLKGNVDLGDRYDVLVTVKGVNVKAGINMKKVDYKLVANKLILSLPKSKITSVEWDSLDYEVIKRYHISGLPVNGLGEPSKSEVKKATKLAKEKVEKTAISAGILDTATTNAKEAIRSIASDLNSKYEIAFE